MHEHGYTNFFFFLPKVKKKYISAEDALRECESCGTKFRDRGGNAVLITKVTHMWK